MKKKPRTFKPPRWAQVNVHVQYTLDGLDKIANELEKRERKLGRNFEDREEWRRTWDEFKKQTRDRGR